jgi:hypothetical protein
MGLLVSFGLFILPSITIIGLRTVGLYYFFKGKEEMDED